MNVICAICQDLLEPSHDIFNTPCGHVFHFPCLNRWLEKVHNCPQCRQKVIRDKLTRIYFNISSSEDIKEDSTTLQQKVDSLSFQIKLKEKEYNTCNKENAILKKQITGLREEFKRLESEMKSKEAAIRGLKDESKYLLEKNRDYDDVKQERNKLQEKIKLYQGVKDLICGSEDYVKNMLNRTTDVSTLTTYLAIMKKELSSSVSKRKELREVVKKLQQNLQSMEKKENDVIDSYRKQIEELEKNFTICQSENEMLQRQVAKLKGEDVVSEDVTTETHETPENIPSRKRMSDFELDFDCTIPRKQKKESGKLKLFSIKGSNDSDIELVLPSPPRKVIENEENSPYLPTKSKSILSIKDRSSQYSGSSVSKRNILPSKKSNFVVKKSVRNDDLVAFDGFGGHSKLETFPVSKKSPSKLKRSINDTSKNKKIKIDLTTKGQLDSYVINLT